MGVCVPDFRYICLAFRLARSRETHKYTRIQGKLEISSTGCSPHVDFENTFFNLFDFLYQKREMTPLFHFIFPFHVVWAIWKKNSANSIHAKRNRNLLLSGLLGIFSNFDKVFTK